MASADACAATSCGAASSRVVVAWSYVLCAEDDGCVWTFGRQPRFPRFPVHWRGAEPCEDVVVAC